MKTLYFTIILFVSILFSMGLSKQTAYAEDKTPPVIITQVELGSPLVLALDNQTCTSPPEPKLTNNCRTDLIPDHNVRCSYFIGSSTCEPLHQVTSGTNQSCLGGFSTSGASQWFDMYNISNMTVDLQNFTAFDKLNYGPYGNDGPFSTIMELKPHEKCTFPWSPVDQALSMGLNNMSMSISYNYDGKYYNVSTPSFSDIYNDTRTWQFDGNKWSFAQNGTVMEQNMTTSDHLATFQESPLKQFKSGINAADVKCSDGFTLVIKSEGDSPACINESSVDRLVRQGWWAWNDKVGDTVVNTPDKRDFDNKTCGMTDTVSSIVGTNGFVKDDLPKDGITYPGKNLTSLVGQVIQFSIKPNSDGYIAFTYDFNQYPGDACKVTTKDVISASSPGKPNISISDLLSSPTITEVDQTMIRNDIAPLGNSGDILVKLVSAEDVNDHVVKVTYKITSTPISEIGKSYWIGFWWHSGVVVTVGNNLYNGTALSGPRFG